MERTYNLNEVALMSGFTDRTLRNYLKQGLLHGEKTDGVWHFTDEDLQEFFSDPYVKEGLRIKRTGTVYDFLAGSRQKDGGACVILDIPAGFVQSQKISDFFCKEMEKVTDTVFSFDWNNGICRVILCGPEEQIAVIMREYDRLKEKEQLYRV